MTTLDTELLREHLGPDGPWAKSAGDSVKRLRITLGFSEERLAADVGVSVTTIKKVEAGRIVPRDYLRAAIAATLRRDVADIWPPMSCERVRGFALEVV